MRERSGPARDGEMLCGGRAIADFLGVTRRQAYHWAEQGGMPTFKIGSLVCARPERLREWLAAQEAASKAPGA